MIKSEYPCDKCSYEQFIKHTNAVVNDFKTRTIKNYYSYNFHTIKHHYWKTTFPSKKRIKVKHEYTPARSSGLGSFYTFNDHYKTDSWNVYSIGYIITTGNNWQNGIEDFTLIVKGKGHIKVGYEGKFDEAFGHYTFKKKNFKPKSELGVAFAYKDELAYCEPGNLKLIKTVDGPANFRVKPKGKVIMRIPDNAEVLLVGCNKNNWYKVKYQEKEGPSLSWKLQVEYYIRYIYS